MNGSAPQSTVITIFHEVAGKLKLRLVVAHEPMSPPMHERVMAIPRISRQLEDVFMAGEVDRPPYPHEDEDTDAVPATGTY